MKRGYKNSLESSTSIPVAGEKIFEIASGRSKTGDGVRVWRDLPYDSDLALVGPQGPPGPQGPQGISGGIGALITVPPLELVVDTLSIDPATTSDPGSMSAADKVKLDGLSATSGDVEGPASSVDDNVVFFDGITGKLIKDSGITLSGSNTGDQDLTDFPSIGLAAGLAIALG